MGQAPASWYSGEASRERRKSMMRRFPKSVLFCALAMATTGAAHAQTFKVLHSFLDTPDVATPWSQLLKKGKAFYGAALQGGASNNGAVYRMGAKGNVTILYSFQGGTDGRRPLAEVIADDSGNLYGVTENGGTHDAGT